MVVSSRKTLFTSAFAVTAAFTLSACATLPEPSTPMRLGQAAAPPTAFLAFCERSPSACSDAPAEVIRTVAKAELAQRSAAAAQLATGRQRNNLVATAAVQTQKINWSEAFAEARRRREVFDAPAEKQRPDWAAAFAAARAARAQAEAAAKSQAQMTETLEATKVTLVTETAPAEPTKLAWAGKAEVPAVASPSFAKTAPAPAEALAMTPALWTKLNKVNDKINRAIARKTDLANYGKLDYWTLPLADGTGAGDCEDYVLEKKRALIEDGLPASALSIAVVTTSWGESHAVLVVETDYGDYVLDNTTPWILPWEKTTLTWHERQVAGSAFRWASVGATPTYQIAKTTLSIRRP